MANPIIKIKTGNEKAYGNNNGSEGFYLPPLQDGELAYNAQNNGLYIGYKGINYLLSVSNGNGYETQNFHGTADNALVASKLGSKTVGSKSRPIYLSSGSPTAISSVDVSYGGTGATTAEGARDNLGITTLVNNLEDKIQTKGIHYIIGNGSDSEGVWTGSNSDITQYYDGMVIAYKIVVAGSGSGTTLNINNLGAKSIKLNNNTTMTTHYPVGAILLLTYSSSDGYFKIANYDSNNKVSLYREDGDGSDIYPLLFHYTKNSDLTNADGKSTTSYVKFNKNITIDPKTGTLTSTKFSGIDFAGTNFSASGDYSVAANHGLVGAGVLNIKGGSTVYLDRGASTSLIFQKGGAEHARFDTSGHFMPGTTNTYNIGSSSNKWKNIYATTFYGSLSGNASTASKIGTTDVGSSTKPVYIKAGTPTECDGTLGVNISGKAATADAWTTGHTFTISGTAGGTAPTVKGDSNVTLVLPTSLSNLTSVTAATFNGNLSGTANVATLLGTIDVGDSNTPIWIEKGTPKVVTGLDLDTTGNAATATKWKTARTFSISGTASDTTSHSVNGSANVTLTLPKTLSGFTTITSNSFSGALSGNASTATTWQTARNFSISGTANGAAVSVNGGANVTLTIPKEISGFTSIKSAAFYQGNYALTRLYSSLVPYGTAVSANADLNTVNYIKVGNYYCSANATATTLTNCPTKNAFMMQVYSPLSTTIDNETSATYVYRLRKLTEYQNGKEWVQTISSGSTAGTFTYGSWYLVPQSAITIDNANSTITLTKGNSTTPVYINSSGNFATCNPYAGGTSVTLNGTAKSGLSASFYAPTASGTSGQILQSGGANTAPSWISTLSVGNGGTGATSFTSGAALIGAGTGAVTTRSITNNTSKTAVTASTDLITANTLYYHSGNSNLTTVGTISSGTWNGTTIAVAYGGTGLTSSPSMLTNLGSTSADTVLKASPRPGVTGTLAVSNGGTGATTFTSGAVLIGNGTGAIITRSITNNTSKTAVTASTDLITANTLFYHSGNSNLTTVGTITSGTWNGTTVAVAYGGTGATTAANARTKLGVPPTSHASSATTYGAATGDNYGHVKLSDATNSSSAASSGIAASPKAVKAAYDLAASKISSNTSSIELNSTGSLASYGGYIDFHYHNADKKPLDSSGNIVESTPNYTSRIIEDSAGTLAINSVKIKGSTITTGTWNGTAIGVGYGGTGKTSHTTNSVLVGNSTSNLKNIASASGAFYATSANGEPKFGTLPVAQGGTGKTTLTSGYALIGNGTSAIATRAILNNIAKGPSGWVSQADSTELINHNTLAYWNGAYTGTTSNLSVLGTISTGVWNGTTIAIAYGGTGLTSNPSMLVNLSSTSADTVFKASPRPGVTGTLAVTNGGTGVTTLTSGAALIGNGTGAISTRSITNNTSKTAVTASTNLITANTLYYHSGNSNITTVGTISSGTWNGTTVAVAYGGTGNTSQTANRLIYSENASKLSSSGHYASSSKVAINSTSAPTETLYVNGTFKASGNSTFDGTIYASSILPRTDMSSSYTLGSTSYTWYDIYSRSLTLYDGTNGYTGGQIYTTVNNATTSITTVAQLGNATATGIAGNRYGILRLYNEGSTYLDLVAHRYATNSTSTAATSRTIYLRDHGATAYLAATTTKSAVGSATLPVYVTQSGVITACTASSVFSAFSSSTNTLSITVAGQTRTANAVNSVSNTWANGTTAGPTIKTTVNGVAGSAVTIPSASNSASGVVTTGTQTFAGAKTFNNNISVGGTATVTGLISGSGGLKVSGRVDGGGDDEGIVVSPASNGYAGITLGSSQAARTTLYLLPDTTSRRSIWRYHDGTTATDISHPGIAGEIVVHTAGAAQGNGSRPVYVNSSSQVIQCDLPTSGSWFKGVPCVGSDGVMEIGAYLDFHGSNTSTDDYTVRINATGGNKNIIYLPGVSGQFVVHTNDTQIGSSTKPVYIASSGSATACSYNLGANIYSFWGSLSSGGWAALNGKANSPAITVSYNNVAANWNSGTYSSSLVFGDGDTRGMIDCAYNNPTISFAGGHFGGSTNDNPVWYMKITGTSGGTYNLNGYVKKAGDTMSGQLTINNRLDAGCLVLNNQAWTGYGTGDPSSLTAVEGRVYFKVI